MLTQSNSVQNSILWTGTRTPAWQVSKTYLKVAPCVRRRPVEPWPTGWGTTPSTPTLHRRLLRTSTWHHPSCQRFIVTCFIWQTKLQGDHWSGSPHFQYWKGKVLNLPYMEKFHGLTPLVGCKSFIFSTEPYATQHFLDLLTPRGGGGVYLSPSFFLFSWIPGGSDLLKNGLMNKFSQKSSI